MNTVKLIRSSLIAISLMINPLHAAGLGKLNLSSQLGQPLHASIAIIGTEDYDHGQLIFTIADQKTHKRLGVSYPRIKSSLKMTLLGDHAARQLIINTRKSINEPFIEFILRMKTPNGVYLKTVSLLLDTPGNSTHTSAFGKP